MLPDRRAFQSSGTGSRLSPVRARKLHSPVRASILDDAGLDFAESGGAAAP